MSSPMLSLLHSLAQWIIYHNLTELKMRKPALGSGRPIGLSQITNSHCMTLSFLSHFSILPFYNKTFRNAHASMVTYFGIMSVKKLCYIVFPRWLLLEKMMFMYFLFWKLNVSRSLKKMQPCSNNKSDFGEKGQLILLLEEILSLVFWLFARQISFKYRTTIISQLSIFKNWEKTEVQMQNRHQEAKIQNKQEKYTLKNSVSTQNKPIFNVWCFSSLPTFWGIKLFSSLWRLWQLVSICFQSWTDLRCSELSICPEMSQDLPKV